MRLYVATAPAAGRHESIAPVLPAQPVVCSATVCGPANSKPITIDVDDEQHGSLHALGAVGPTRDGDRGAPITT
jgi:hypothetical protein